MMTSPISNVFHPTLVDQTDRDSHRERDPESEHRRQQVRHPHPAPPSAHTDESSATTDGAKKIGLLLDVKA